MAFNPTPRADCARGAPMGRGDSGGDFDSAKPLHLVSCPLDSGGYDRGGAYWGLGAPLYCVHDASGDFVQYLRAHSRDAAKREFRTDWPDCWFHGERKPRPIEWGNDTFYARVTPEGLRFIASNEGRAVLAESYNSEGGGYDYAEAQILNAIHGNGLEFIAPEHLGLTEMPAFSEGLAYAPDSDDRQWDGEGAPIWGFPDYMIRDPWQELKNKGRVLFPVVARS